MQSEVVYDGPIFRIRKDKVTVVGGKTSYRDILEHNGGAVILAVKEDGRILMVRQFRKALEREVLELPAGKIDGDEDPMDTALRELKEETGYQAGSIRHLTTIQPELRIHHRAFIHLPLQGFDAGRDPFRRYRGFGPL